MGNDLQRYVIIGNGIAGTSCAETIRKHHASAEITLIGDEPHTLYNRVALPRYLRMAIPRSKVFIRNVEWHEKMRIRLLLGVPAQRIDVNERTVVLADGTAIPFDRLLIATGGRANHLQVAGAAGDGVYNFQTLEDAENLLAGAQAATAAVSLGGSFIGYELTEAFRKHSLQVTWIMREPYFLGHILGPDGGELVDRLARSHGIAVRYNDEIREILREDGHVSGVMTRSGAMAHTQVIGTGIGLKLNTEIVEGTGIQTGRGIITDSHLETSVPGIYAAGDVAEFYDVTVGYARTVGTYDNAASHGRLVAINMMGGDKVHAEVPAYTSSLFDSTLTVVGTIPWDHNDLETHTEVDMEAGIYRQVYLREGRLVGAILIGDRTGRLKLMELIRERTPIDTPKELLALR